MPYLKFLFKRFIKNPLFLFGIALLITGFLTLEDDFTPPKDKPELHWRTLKDIHVANVFRGRKCIVGTDIVDGSEHCLSQAAILKFKTDWHIITRPEVYRLIDERKQLSFGWYYTCAPWRRFFSRDDCRRIMEVHHEGTVIVSYKDSVKAIGRRNTLGSKFMLILHFVGGFLLILLLAISYYVYPPEYKRD